MNAGNRGLSGVWVGSVRLEGSFGISLDTATLPGRSHDATTWVGGGRLWVAAALSVGATPLAACDPVWLPIARPDGISVFVAVALADTVLDTAIAALKGRMHPAFEARLDTIVGTTTGGQRVRLPGWEDPAGTVEGVLVPWAYGRIAGRSPGAGSSPGSRRAPVAR